MNDTKKWFESAFDKDYLTRYAHRNQFGALSEVNWVEATVQAQKGWFICDACCGQGRHLEVWKEKGYDGVGFDLSADLLAASKVAVCQADQRRWSFASDSFDLITVMFTSIGYFSNDNDNTAIFDEIARCLKPGGRFVVDAINIEYLKNNFVADTDKNLDSGRLVEKRRFEGNRVIKDVSWHSPTGLKEYQESVRLFSEAELRTICELRGLEINEVADGFTEQEHSRLLLVGQKK